MHVENTGQEQDALVADAAAGELSAEIQHQAACWRWLLTQMQAGGLTLQDEFSGQQRLWADATNFEGKVEQAVRTQEVLRAWQQRSRQEYLARLASAEASHS